MAYVLKQSLEQLDKSFVHEYYALPVAQSGKHPELTIVDSEDEAHKFATAAQADNVRGTEVRLKNFKTVEV